MRRCFRLAGAMILASALGASSLAAEAGAYRRLAPLPPPKIVAAAQEFPGGRFAAGNLLDGNAQTEFATAGKGTETFVEFDFGTPVSLGGFRHQDRRDLATIAASELVFLDAAGKPLATLPVEHVNKSSGVTFFAAPEPIIAQRVRWRVTKLGAVHTTVGGAEIAFFAAGQPEPTPQCMTIDAQPVPVVDRVEGKAVQTLRVEIDYPYGLPCKATVRVEGFEPKKATLRFGRQSLDYSIAALESPRPLSVAVDVGGQTVAQPAVTLKPARQTVIYLLPHSHTDIGYTAIQTDIETKQVNNLLQGMAIARQTAGNPPGARFVWNVEVLWAADLYLRRLSPSQRQEFFEAVKNGQVSLNGMYLNELTGLCRPEELLRLFRYATRLAEQTGVPVDAAMISDVPGYTWGTVTAMAQAGVKYFSVAPNYFDRIGDILVQWENKPFYWLSPSGKEKVLVWIPSKGYALSHILRQGLSPQFVEDYQIQLDRSEYPYAISYLRWSGHGDNAVPDPSICDFVKEWNARHVWPQFVISSTSQAFAAFEKRYGDKLPEVRGDWTPYWEDGAGSSSAETALNRASSDRLAQAETLWAMLNPAGYPAAAFDEAWINVLLYSEHTWGAWCSIKEPAHPMTVEQWTIKQSYATAANLQSRQLTAHALDQRRGKTEPPGDGQQIDVFNTTSWPRTELLLLPHDFPASAGDCVSDDHGQPVPSQRLASRELAILVRDLPAFSGRRYTIGKGKPHAEGPPATASGTTLDNGRLRFRVDEKTGGGVELRAAGIDANLVDTASGHALNDYLYLIGDDLAGLKGNGPVKITVRDKGPLVASLRIESDAPGCHHLSRETRLVAGGDFLELINTVDKKRLEAADYMAKDGKESVNFAFAFNVPDGQMRLDVPLGAIRPELDQMPSACKNWLTVGRWAEVANRDFGVTWLTLDAPLLQVGGITATLLGSQANPDVWQKKIEPSQRLYSWAMNNHWGTNYRAYQEGPVVFRYVVRPHRGANLAEAARLAVSFGQPLVAAPARGDAPSATPLLRIESADVLAIAMKPSDDCKALIVRLFGASGQPATAKLAWGTPAVKQVWLSDTSEKPIRKTGNEIAVPAWGVVTLRAELVK